MTVSELDLMPGACFSGFGEALGIALKLVLCICSTALDELVGCASVLLVGTCSPARGLDTSSVQTTLQNVGLIFYSITNLTQ